MSDESISNSKHFSNMWGYLLDAISNEIIVTCEPPHAEITSV